MLRKEVADLILLDDNFATIVEGIEHGRIIFDNLKKLIRYTMADNVAEMYCYWVYIIIRVPLPMGTIGMLLSTLGADVFPAISLGTLQLPNDFPIFCHNSFIQPFNFSSRRCRIGYNETSSPKS